MQTQLWGGLKHFKEGTIRTVNLEDFELKVKIEKKLISDEGIDKSKDGKQIYGRRIKATIANCPRCRDSIPIDFTYDHKNLYIEDECVECPKCGFEFTLVRWLKWAFIMNDNGYVI